MGKFHWLIPSHLQIKWKYFTIGRNGAWICF